MHIKTVKRLFVTVPKFSIDANLGLILVRELKNSAFMVVGVGIVALSYVIFQVPHNLAAGGVTGTSLIIHEFIDIPLGLLFWLLNLPLLVLGFIFLGRWRFLLRTLFASSLFAIFIDFLLAKLPLIMSQIPLTQDLLLTTIYGGIVGGIGGGLIYRAGATMGGTGIIGRIIQLKTGRPLSAVYFYVDGVIILTAGLVFGWEISLYAFLMLFLNGLASDYTLEGPSTVRTATIITENPKQIIHRITDALHHGVSYWEITGGYSGQQRYMVMCTITRPQVAELKRLVRDVDANAFVTIGVSHEAIGSGFKPVR